VTTGKVFAALGAGALTVALGAGLAVAVAAGAPELPLRPLAVDGPAPDDLRHVLVRVPAGAGPVRLDCCLAEDRLGHVGSGLEHGLLIQLVCFGGDDGCVVEVLQEAADAAFGEVRYVLRCNVAEYGN